MKSKDLEKYKGKKNQELRLLVTKMKFDAQKSYVERKAGKDKNLKTVKNTRHDIAQILTIIRENEILESQKETK